MVYSPIETAKENRLRPHHFLYWVLYESPMLKLHLHTAPNIKTKKGSPQKGASFNFMKFA
jgi:hypothetical protein